jgi:hypothetical protein
VAPPGCFSSSRILAALLPSRAPRTPARFFAPLCAFLALVFGELWGAPAVYVLQHGHGQLGPDPNEPVFVLRFYREAFPLIVQAVLVAVPSVWGIRQSADLRRFRLALRILLWSVAIAALGVMVIREPRFRLLLNRPEFWQGLRIRFLPIIVYWPVGYWIASAIARRGQSRIASL